MLSLVKNIYYEDNIFISVPTIIVEFPHHSRIDSSCQLLERCLKTKSSKFNKCDWQFLCGRNRQCIGTIGFKKKHNIKHNIGVYEEDVVSSSKLR